MPPMVCLLYVYRTVVIQEQMFIAINGHNSVYLLQK